MQDDRMPRLEFAASITGIVLVFAALTIIWLARLSATRDLYVSELGAQVEPTARWFMAALLLLAAGGAAIAWAGRSVRSTRRVLALWSPSVSLWVASALFAVASQVTCTRGCPVPYGESFTAQDFSHTLIAVLAFAAACLAMVQSAFAGGRRVLSTLSATAAIFVAVIAGVGGLLSLFRFQQEFGSRLEFVAMSIAVCWLLAFGAVAAARSRAVREPAIPPIMIDSLQR